MGAEIARVTSNFRAGLAFVTLYLGMTLIIWLPLLHMNLVLAQRSQCSDPALKRLEGSGPDP